MDSQIRLDWYRSNVIDNRWRQEVLPHGDVSSFKKFKMLLTTYRSSCFSLIIKL